MTSVNLCNYLSLFPPKLKILHLQSNYFQMTVGQHVLLRNLFLSLFFVKMIGFFFTEKYKESDTKSQPCLEEFCINKLESCFSSFALTSHLNPDSITITLISSFNPVLHEILTSTPHVCQSITFTKVF